MFADIKWMVAVAITLYTTAHRIGCKILLRERLAEMFNDTLTDYVEVFDAKVSKLIDPTHSAVDWNRVTVPKAKVVIVTMDRDGHESVSTRLDKSRFKAGSAVAALVGGVELYGTAHMTSGASPVDALRRDFAPFFPITDASLLFSATDESHIDTRLALVNRSYVSALAQL